MWEHFKQWQPKIKSNKRRLMGAIATPVFLGMVWWLWLLPERRLQADDSHLSRSETAPLTHHHRELPINGIGAIAAVAGGVVLLLNFRNADRKETANLSGADLSGADFSGDNLSGADLSGTNLSDANLSGTDFSHANLSDADLSGANLSDANFSGADLISVNLSGANLRGANLQYANFSGANLRYANLRGADLRHANLSGADLNCAFLSGANLSDANLSGALLFYINSREVKNLEPLQLEAQPSPFLCNIALPAYSKQPNVDPNRDCDRIPQLLSARYDISLEEAHEIVYEARQHRWD